MIYLNNTATSFPKPHSVIDAINDYLLSPPSNVGRNSESALSLLDETRHLILNFFNASDNFNVIFTSGSTESINMTLFGLELKNKEVIISSSEHNSVIRPLMELQNRGDISIKIAQCNEYGYLDINSISDLINDKTALIVINYISNVTGNVQNINEISKLAKNKGLKLLIDGSQASGNIKINLDESNPDFFAFTGHKSLFGIQGIGGLIINKNIEIKPFKYGGTGFKSTMLTQPIEFPHKYEAGTQNIPGIISIKKGIEFINEIGLENIINHKIKQIKYIISELCNLDNIKLYYDESTYSYSVLSFNIDKLAPEEVSYILKSGFDIELRSGIHCAPLIHKNLGTYPKGTVRVSPSFFTKDDEIEIFVNVIKDISKDYK
jgi:cysteine desulfurase family protein